MTLVPELVIRLNSLLLAMLIVQMSITEDVHSVLQAVIIVEKLETAGDSEHNLCVLAYMQSVDGSRILNHKVTGPSDPVISDPGVSMASSFSLSSHGGGRWDLTLCSSIPP